MSQQLKNFYANTKETGTCKVTYVRGRGASPVEMAAQRVTDAFQASSPGMHVERNVVQTEHAPDAVTSRFAQASVSVAGALNQPGVRRYVGAAGTEDGPSALAPEDLFCVLRSVAAFRLQQGMAAGPSNGGGVVAAAIGLVARQDPAAGRLLTGCDAVYGNSFADAWALMAVAAHDGKPAATQMLDTVMAHRQRAGHFERNLYSLSQHSMDSAGALSAIATVLRSDMQVPKELDRLDALAHQVAGEGLKAWCVKAGMPEKMAEDVLSTSVDLMETLVTVTQEMRNKAAPLAAPVVDATQRPRPVPSARSPSPGS